MTSPRLRPIRRSAVRGCTSPSNRSPTAVATLSSSILLEDLAVDIRTPRRTGEGVALRSSRSVDLGTVEHARGTERALANDTLMAAGVQARPAPGVVGIPGVGGQDVEQTTSIGDLPWSPNHKSGVGLGPAVRGIVSGHGHQVEPRWPVGAELHRDVGRPTAALGVGVGRGWCVQTRQPGGRPHRLPISSPPLDGDAKGSRPGRDVGARRSPRRSNSAGRDIPRYGRERSDHL